MLICMWSKQTSGVEKVPSRERVWRVTFDFWHGTQD